MISRRGFLKKTVSSVCAMGVYVVVPVPNLSSLTGNAEKDGGTRCLYWIDVLVKGVDYVPGTAKMDITYWNNDKKIKKAHSLVDLVFKQNEQVLSGTGVPETMEMNQIVNRNKRVQFLLESIEGPYVFNPYFPKVTCHEDPFRAQIFHDLGAFIVKRIIELVLSDFVGFNPLDLKLLRAAERFFARAVAVNESATALCPSTFREPLIKNVSTSYNNLGLVLNFLGDTKGAYRAYMKALELNPEDEQIIQNLSAIDRNASYIREGVMGRYTSELE